MSSHLPPCMSLSHLSTTDGSSVAQAQARSLKQFQSKQAEKELRASKAPIQSVAEDKLVVARTLDDIGFAVKPSGNGGSKPPKAPKAPKKIVDPSFFAPSATAAIPRS